MPFLALPSPYIERVHLLQEAFYSANIVWLDAPAGFGKSVLMTEYALAWQKQNKIALPVVLAREDTASDFILKILQASQGSLESAEELLSQKVLDLVEKSLYSQALLLLLEELNKSKVSLLLCLDNVQYLDAQSWSLLLSLLELFPRKFQLLLAGRYIPQSLGRIRLIEGLRFLKAKELKLTETQVQKHLLVYDLKEASATVAKLSRYLQGWCAGLVIWKNAFKTNAKLANDPEQIQPFLEDYIQGEMLGGLDEEFIGFLRLCALLKRFDEAMMQHFFTDDRYHLLLKKAVQYHFFTTNGSWYECHSVLTQFLASSLPLSQRLSIHRQAFFWLSNQPHSSVLALQHALSAQMSEEVQDWVMTKSEEIFASLDIAGLLEWFSTLNNRTLYGNPRLLSLACWAYLLTQQREQAGLLLKEIEQLEQLQNFELLALKGALARLDNQLDQAANYCTEAYHLAPKERFSLRIYMCSILSQIRLAQGDQEGARRWNAQTQELAHHSQVPALEALSLYDALRIEMQRGNFAQARSLLERSLTILAKNPQQAEPLPLGRLYLYQAWLLWLSGGNADKLNQCLQEGIRLCTQLRDVSLCYGYAIRALSYAYSEDYQLALDEIDSAQWQMQRWSVEPKSYLWLDFLRINVWLNQGQLQRAKSTLDRHLALGIEALPQPEIFPMLPKLAMLTYARSLLLTDKKKECLQYLEQHENLMGSALGQGLTDMLRSQALRSTHPQEAQRILASILRLMQRENLTQELLLWLPGLREAGSHKNEEVLLQANLSDRELDVLRKIEQGLSNQEIADALFISLHTVKTHARKINTKLAAKNRTQALHKAQALKLL